ncbi:phospholipid scramblase 1-like [Orycteropus afer afer]|uniref:Phospholipid scramblase 1-like n=1 Tax=Orycteropus afer afer TaxID=1230840 RepID=A0AC54ZA83_ORYAF|nr:phospholipid scramblase 1-like [Orycteropus afer afer]
MTEKKIEDVDNRSSPLNILNVNQLVVNQNIEVLEVFTCFETSNKYDIMNKHQERIYFAEEKSNCFFRHVCGYLRPFTITIYDNVGRDVIILHRSLRCCCCQKVTVEAPPGNTIGYIYQSCHPFLPKFKIKNEDKEDVMKIRGPCMLCKCFKNVNFNLLSLDEEILIGKISKKWAGFMTEVFTDANKFKIKFPYDLDVKMKAVLLGACLLISSALNSHHGFGIHIAKEASTRVSWKHSEFKILCLDENSGTVIENRGKKWLIQCDFL